MKLTTPYPLSPQIPHTWLSSIHSALDREIAPESDRAQLWHRLINKKQDELWSHFLNSQFAEHTPELAEK